jgi:hypothetical protein
MPMPNPDAADEETSFQTLAAKRPTPDTSRIWVGNLAETASASLGFN